MDTLTIQRSDLADVTAVANTFIDEYMPSANGEYVKIYLYFLRCLSQQAEPLSLEAVAGKLDHTTNYIMKALFYWQENGILSLSTDGGQNVTGIHFLPIARPADKSEARHEPEAAAQPSSSVCEPPKSSRTFLKNALTHWRRNSSLRRMQILRMPALSRSPILDVRSAPHSSNI